MKLFFGAKKEVAAPKVDIPSAIKQNKEAIELLEKRQAHIEKRIQKEEADAREKARLKDKRGALMCLKRKQMFNQQMDQLNNQRLALEQQIMTLESAQSQQVAIDALKTGVQAQKVLNQQMNINNIDRLMDDIQEQKDMQQEIEDVFKQHANTEGDEDLLNELAELEADELEKNILSAGAVPSLAPATGVPTAMPTAATASRVSQSAVPPQAAPSAPAGPRVLSDEEQLAALQAELA
eukprot:GDKI01021137.1.p1 GENE.GDKI01021137.1~~GDKI01021137.1.p1  ORF type:complete len:237 (-),score=106.10 GDKI01021137.1:404-1114(-)